MTIFIIKNWFLIIIYWIFIILISVRIILYNYNVSSIIAWIMIIHILPIIGIIMYLLFGEINISKIKINRGKKLSTPVYYWLDKFNNKYRNYLGNNSSKTARSLFQLYKYQYRVNEVKVKKIKLFTDSNDTITSIINDINLAKNNIDIIFYIWNTDGLIKKVIQALIIAAKRGVSCRIILDSVGSLKFFRSNYHKKLRTAGVIIVEAFKISILHIFINRIDIRQHKKIIIIDNNITYTGSMNMIDPNYYKSNLGKLIDIMVRMEGCIANIMSIIFSCEWKIETNELILPSFPKKISGILCNSAIVQVISSNLIISKNIINQVLVTSIYAARKKLVITTPYLIPSNDLLKAICTAANRGVKVDIIIPIKSDSVLVNWASRVFFTELLDAGVKINQFKGGFLHTKSIIIDNTISIVGTVNLDIRSLKLNSELILIIDDNKFNKQLLKIQKTYIMNSFLIKTSEWMNRPFWKRIIEKLFYLFSPLL
ncbi:MAG: cardiolipin synthase [Candidatus Lightella neohaematopini]|nr:cardiolipin synthase [Candidatus Lightella neohaematopini]